MYSIYQTPTGECVDVHGILQEMNDATHGERLSFIALDYNSKIITVAFEKHLFADQRVVDVAQKHGFRVQIQAPFPEYFD